jgi:hypothetical protein
MAVQCVTCERLTCTYNVAKRIWVSTLKALSAASAPEKYAEEHHAADDAMLRAQNAFRELDAHKRTHRRAGAAGT